MSWRKMKKSELTLELGGRLYQLLDEILVEYPGFNKPNKLVDLLREFLGSDKIKGIKVTRQYSEGGDRMDIYIEKMMTEESEVEKTNG